MGTNHEGSYSASVSAFIRVGEHQLRLAKTNGVTFSLSQPCTISVPAEASAILTINIDGYEDSKQITLREGLHVGQRIVKYDTAPF